MSSVRIRITGLGTAVGWTSVVVLVGVNPPTLSHFLFNALAIASSTMTVAWLLFWLVPDVVRAYGLGFRDGYGQATGAPSAEPLAGPVAHARLHSVE